MLTRRHIRVKVMQCIYALVQSKDDSLQKQEKFLRVSIENMYVLYLLILSLLAELHRLAEKHVSHSSKKYVATEEDKYPDPQKFVKNQLLLQLVNNQALKDELSKRKLDNWYLNDEYVKIIHKAMVSSDIYKKYMSTADSDYAQDRDMVIQLFKEIIAPNENKRKWWR